MFGETKFLFSEPSTTKLIYIYHFSSCRFQEKVFCPFPSFLAPSLSFSFFSFTFPRLFFSKTSVFMALVFVTDENLEHSALSLPGMGTNYLSLSMEPPHAKQAVRSIIANSIGRPWTSPNVYSTTSSFRHLNLSMSFTTKLRQSRGRLRKIFYVVVRGFPASLVDKLLDDQGSILKVLYDARRGRVPPDRSITWLHSLHHQWMGNRVLHSSCPQARHLPPYQCSGKGQSIQYCQGV